MERFVSVSVSEKKSKVSRNNLHIHDDLAFPILSKLPLKSLKRFGCVRKSWSVLFENPHFMKMLRTHFSFNNSSDHGGGGGDTFLFIQEPGLPNNALYLFPNEKFENRIKFDLPPLFQEGEINPYIVSSVSINGIFCLGQDINSGILPTFRVVLWNPATSEFTLIPPSPDESVVPPYRETFFKFHGFGYDRVSDDYKVIQYISFFRQAYEDRSYEPLLEIYSLRSNSWRILNVNIPYYCYNTLWLDTGVYIDGVCHWWGKRDPLDSTGSLVSFDFCNEVLFTTPMLVDIDERCDFLTDRRLVVLNNSIALISNCLNATTFHILILGELGVMESWIKLCIVGPIPSIEFPIGVGKKGDICFIQKNGELVWIDLSTQIIDEIGVKGERFGCHQMGIYKENLLPIGGYDD